MGHLSPTPVPSQGSRNTEENGLERMQKPEGRKECCPLDMAMLSHGWAHRSSCYLYKICIRSRQSKSLQKWERWSPGYLQRSYFQGRMWPLAVLLWASVWPPRPCTYEQNWLDFMCSNVFLKDKVGRSGHCRDIRKGGGRIILITHASYLKFLQC